MATKPKTTIKKTPQKTNSSNAEAVTQGKTVEPKQKTYRVKVSLDPNMIITVKNGFHGPLVYKSRKTQERFVWESFGNEQDMELQELKNAKNSSKAFFENNWFLIDDPEVLEYLGVSQYYKFALSFKTFDELFTKSSDEIKEIISNLSKGQKKSVAYRAKQLITEGVIDSIRVINALEESLGLELIER